MVKLQDGSLVPAAQLLSGEGEDEEGNKLQFKQLSNAAVPTWQAKSEMKDGSKRMRTYEFGFEETNVIVRMGVTDAATAAAAQEKAQAATAKEEPKAAQTAAAAKNASAPQTGSKAAGYNVEKAGYSVSPSKK